MLCHDVVLLYLNDCICLFYFFQQIDKLIEEESKTSDKINELHDSINNLFDDIKKLSIIIRKYVEKIDYMYKRIVMVSDELDFIKHRKR